MTLLPYYRLQKQIPLTYKHRPNINMKSVIFAIVALAAVASAVPKYETKGPFGLPKGFKTGCDKLDHALCDVRVRDLETLYFARDEEATRFLAARAPRHINWAAPFGTLGPDFRPGCGAPEAQNICGAKVRDLDAIYDADE